MYGKVGPSAPVGTEFGTVAIHTRLQKRRESGVYYCRVCIPKKLRHIVGKSEIHISLRTASIRIARERVRLESMKIDRMLAEASGNILPISGLGAFLAPMSYATPITPPSISFLELVESFMAMPEKAKLTGKGKLEYCVTFRLLAELFGEKTPILSITRADLLEHQCMEAKGYYRK